MSKKMLLVVVALAMMLATGRKKKTLSLSELDLMWLGRALVGETEGSSERAMAAVSWCMYQRWQKRRVVGQAFYQMLRAYCQPINPRWSSADAPGCRAHPEMCTTSHLARRARITRMTWNELPAAIRDFVIRFARGEVENPVPGMIDFASRNFPGSSVEIDGNYFGTLTL